jgi:hypothetical protein
LKGHKLPGTNQIQAESEALCSKIHELNYI